MIGIRPITWQRAERWIQVLQGEDQAILHLHGHWDHPSSVVLGIRSYDAVMGKGLAQHLQRALASLQSLVFIGCSGTLEDPNFSSLLIWMREHLGGAEHSHYLLICEGDPLPGAEPLLRDARIMPLHYGKVRADLLSFVRSLAPLKQHPPRVFISYIHDTVEHQARVLALADRLRADGVDAEVDQYNAPPPEGWPLWCERQIAAADFVLMVCSESYYRRISGEDRGKGVGVACEARLIRQLLYDAGAISDKLVPVLFSDASPEQIPMPIKGRTRYTVDTEDGYEELYRRLTGQPRLLRPAFGRIRPMPSRRQRWAERPPPETGKKRPLHEGKLILVGRGEVGKTSLVRRLANNEFRGDESKTQGINITD